MAAIGAKRLAIVAVAGSLAAAGCSSGGSGETPEGFVRGDATVLSVAHPKNWQRGPEPNLALSMQAPRQTAFLSVLKDLSAHGNLDMLEATVEAGPRINAKGYRRTHFKSIKVAGAKEAVRIDYTFTDFQGLGVPGQAVDVGVIGATGHVHAVRLVWQRGRLKGTVVDGVIGSIKVR